MKNNYNKGKRRGWLGPVRYSSTYFLRCTTKSFCILSALLLTGFIANAQEIVSGIVTDTETGGALPGVTIQVKGTATGVITDIDGNYRITASSDDVLVFSYIGYKKQEIAVNGRSLVSISMEIDVTELSEVVVTAMGILKEEKSLGYAITSVEGKELQVTREPSFVNALAGKVAGLVVNSGTNGAGSSSRVTIRGNSSFGTNQPLYVIDGMPMDNSYRGQLDDPGAKYGGTDPGDGLANLNPDDIESISVLKGVSAAALYGNRAQGGVILITTKKGQKNQGLGISFNSNTVFQQMVPYDDYQDVYGVGLFGDLPPRPDDFYYALSWGPKFSEVEEFVDFDGVTRPYKHQSTKDNFGRFYDLGVSTTNSLAISGGNENSTYRLSLSHLHNESPSPGNSYMKRYNVSFRGTSDVGNKLHADYKIDLSRTDRIGKNLLRGDGRGALGHVFSRMSNTMNIDLMKQKDEAGDYIYSGYLNPWPGIELVQADDHRDRVIAMVKLDYNFLKVLKATVQGSLDRSNIDDLLVVKPNSFSDNSGLMNQTRQVIEEDNVIGMLSYDQKFSDFTVNANIGVQHRFYKNSSLNAVGRNFVREDLVDWTNIPALKGDGTANTEIRSPDDQKKVNSVFGAVQFGFKDIFFLELTGRNDWASALSSTREGFYDNSLFYPSANFSMVFSDWYNPIPNILSFGKLRLSWGQTGSDFRPHLTDLTYLIENSNRGIDNAAINGSTLPPTNIKPEATTEVEIGTQLNFFVNRLKLDFAFYNRETSDFLLSSNVSQSTGFSSIYLNAGSMRNRGIELLISGTPVQVRNFSWDISINLAKNNNKVLELSEELSETGLQHYQVVRSLPGYPMGSIFGTPIRRGPNGDIVYKQVDTDDDNVPDAVVYERGKVTYDEQGNPLRDENGSIIVDNQVYLGSGNPKLTGGLYNTFSYKGFSLSVLIDGQFGGSVYSDTHKWASYFGLSQESLVGRDGNYVPDGVVNGSEDENNPVYTENTLPFDPLDQYTGNGFNITEAHTFDNSFIKLRQVTLGYRLPSKILNRIPFRSITISAVARNLFYIRKDVPIVDPNSADTIGNGFGYETGGLPSSRSFGLNLSFNL